MLSDALQYKDSMRNGSVIRAGDVQRMTTGIGVKHSEFNLSNNEFAHFLQIWILPDNNNIAPDYEEKHFDASSKTNQWRLIASHNARDESLLIHQDVDLFATLLDAGQRLDYQARENRGLYLHIAKSSVKVNGYLVGQGDAVCG